MTAPEHLWSGDWEAESEAAAARRRAGVPLAAPPPDPDAPAPASAPPGAMNGDSLPPHETESPFIVRVERGVQVERGARAERSETWRGRAARERKPLHIPWRPIGIALATALVVVAAAFGLSALFRGGPAAGAGSPRAGWLGLRLGVLPTGAVVVTGIAARSPAASAGVRTGDVITEVQGRPVAAPVDVALAVDALGAGEKIEIGGRHGTRAYTAQVRLAARPAGAANRAGP